MSSDAAANAYEIRPDPQDLTTDKGPFTPSSDQGHPEVDYEPYPEKSVPLSPEQEKIVKAITSLYSGSASREDMEVYAQEAIYDDPWSYCDTRYKIAGQWYGIPKIFSLSRTRATQILVASPTEIIYKQKQEYTPKSSPTGKAVNSLVSLSLDEQGKVKYHKDMWNKKDYSHEGLGKWMKKLNGDHLTKITQPEKDL
ncbi:MAG: hypothetical protein MMC33_010592 [Icmadophila ericetorum]|nr:hypothetical protein [Icmadophila ericetorum]